MVSTRSITTICIRTDNNYRQYNHVHLQRQSPHDHRRYRSFGNAVLNRFLRTDIGEIRIFSRDEKKQDDMRHEYQAKMPEVAGKIKFYIGDVRNKSTLKGAMKGVDYIFHAAALKQVPSCEFFPMEAVKTNVIGTDNVLDAAIDEGVKCVICLSTACLPPATGSSASTLWSSSSTEPIAHNMVNSSSRPSPNALTARAWIGEASMTSAHSTMSIRNSKARFSATSRVRCRGLQIYRSRNCNH